MVEGGGERERERQIDRGRKRERRADKNDKQVNYKGHLTYTTNIIPYHNN